MFNQYLLIVIANTFRFIFDVLIVINVVIIDRAYPESCPPSENTTTVWDVVLNVLTGFLTHLFPIFILLRIYALEERPEEICRSLIVTSGSDR